MKRPIIIIIVGIVLMTALTNTNIDYSIAVITGLIGAVLTIAGTVLLLRDRRREQAAAREAAEKAQLKRAADEMMRKEAERSAAIARQNEEAEAAARREEWERTYGRFTTNIAGVTFDNDDGSSRQKILRNLAAKSGSDEVELQEYNYKGHPAVRVLISGQCIGNIPKERVQEALAVMDIGVENAHLNVESFNASDRGRTYRADLTLIYKKL